MLALLIPLAGLGIVVFAVGVFLWTINGGATATRGAFVAAGGLTVLIISVTGLAF